MEKVAGSVDGSQHVSAPQFQSDLTRESGPNLSPSSLKTPRKATVLVPQIGPGSSQIRYKIAPDLFQRLKEVRSTENLGKYNFNFNFKCMAG